MSRRRILLFRVTLCTELVGAVLLGMFGYETLAVAIVMSNVTAVASRFVAASFLGVDRGSRQLHRRQLLGRLAPKSGGGPTRDDEGR